MSIAWTRGSCFTFLVDRLLVGCIGNANWNQDTMNQYAYIFTLYGWLQLLSASVPIKVRCQSLYHIDSVMNQPFKVRHIYLGPLWLFVLIFPGKLHLLIKPLSLSPYTVSYISLMGSFSIVHMFQLLLWHRRIEFIHQLAWFLHNLCHPCIKLVPNLVKKRPPLIG